MIGMDTKDYKNLRLFAFIEGSKYNIMSFDIEDICHDAIILIQQNHTPQAEWKLKVKQEIGNFITKNNRDKESLFDTEALDYV